MEAYDNGKRSEGHTAVASGYLYKIAHNGSIFAKWHRRYYVLYSDGLLFSYVSDRAKSSNRTIPVGRMCLRMKFGDGTSSEDCRFWPKRGEISASPSSTVTGPTTSSVTQRRSSTPGDSTSWEPWASWPPQATGSLQRERKAGLQIKKTRVLPTLFHTPSCRLRSGPRLAVKQPQNLHPVRRSCHTMQLVLLPAWQAWWEGRAEETAGLSIAALRVAGRPRRVRILHSKRTSFQ